MQGVGGAEEGGAHVGAGAVLDAGVALAVEVQPQRADGDVEGPHRVAGVAPVLDVLEAPEGDGEEAGGGHVEGAPEALTRRGIRDLDYRAAEQPRAPEGDVEEARVLHADEEAPAEESHPAVAALGLAEGDVDRGGEEGVPGDVGVGGVRLEEDRGEGDPDGAEGGAERARGADAAAPGGHHRGADDQEGELRAVVEAVVAGEDAVPDREELEVGGVALGPDVGDL